MIMVNETSLSKPENEPARMLTDYFQEDGQYLSQLTIIKIADYLWNRSSQN
jgi:hypothetical protein